MTVSVWLFFSVSTSGFSIVPDLNFASSTVTPRLDLELFPIWTVANKLRMISSDCERLL